jgi:hypothetical protein
MDSVLNIIPADLKIKLMEEIVFSADRQSKEEEIRQEA